AASSHRRGCTSASSRASCGRRRPAHHSGAAGPQLALDDADVQPRRCEEAATRLRPRAPSLMTALARDKDVEGFLALLAAQRGRRTVEAYRRDLAAARAYLGKPLAAATVEELELYTAHLRADGLSASTIARRTAALRSFYRHQQLLGARTDNPAAAVALPRRPKPLPKTLSAGEAERLIEAAAGTTPRALRDRALVELLYGAGLRVSEAVGL